MDHQFPAACRVYRRPPVGAPVRLPRQVEAPFPRQVEAQRRQGVGQVRQAVVQFRRQEVVLFHRQAGAPCRRRPPYLESRRRLLAAPQTQAPPR